MDGITTSLQNIDIKESHVVPHIITRIPGSCVHQQKCFIPPKAFWSLNLLPGDPVTLLHWNTKIFLRAFPSSHDSNIIEVYGIVECPIQTCVDFSSEFIKIPPKKFTSIVIDVVCNSTLIKKWLSQKPKLLSLLERRILKNLYFCAGSTVQYETISDALTWGVKKIVIVQANTNDVGIIGSKTKINLRQVITEHQYQQCHAFSLNRLFGADRILNEFLEIIDANIKYEKLSTKLLSPIKQVLLAGPSGSGKSSLVQVLCKRKACSLVQVHGQDVAHRDPGQAERQLRNYFQEAFLSANNNELCIVLLEDVDVLCPSGKNITAHTSRLSSQLMLLLDKCQETSGIVVIATTNKPSNISTSLRRHGRLAKEVFMGKPSENERKEIIYKYLDLFGNLNFNEKSEISETVANITPGFLGVDLMFLCQMTCSKITALMTPEDNVNICIKTMKDVLLEMKPASLRNEVELVPGGTVSPAIGGLDQVKKQLQLSVYCSLLHPQTYSRLGIQNPRGILLYGPPGCAKTSLVKSLATVGDITVLCASSASIYSPYVGDAEKAIVNLFHSARQNTPAIIFLDEIDSLIGSRSYSNNSNNVQERVLAALLTQMDGIGFTKEVADCGEECVSSDNVMVIAATNRPNEIDPALLRPGRFDKHIYVPPPDATSRLHILSIVTKNTPLDDDVDLEEIAAKTENYSGADLKNLHMETVLQAMQEEGIDVANIKKSHYDAVLEVIKPSLGGYDDENFRKMF